VKGGISMALFEEVFYLGIGAVSSLKKNIDKLVEQGKVSQEEAQRIFEDLRQKNETDERLNPLSLSMGFMMYTRKKIQELLRELQETGKISKEEAKKFYEKFIPEEIKEKEKKSNEYVTKEEFSKILEKLEAIEKSLKPEE
jgi:polyhydroxyalkanoate synthesis regulator phasin